MEEKELLRTAYHELGHACVNLILKLDSEIERITIKSEDSETLRYVSYSLNSSKCTHSASDNSNRICRLKAGMAFEEYFLENFENGNSSDLEKATDIAKLMITKWGMSNRGFMRKENLSEADEEEINAILKEEFENAKLIAKENEDNIKNAAKILLKDGIIEVEKLKKY